MSGGDRQVTVKRAAASLIAFFSFFAAVVPADARKADLQYWHTETVSWKVADDWKVSLSNESYFDDDASHRYYHEGDIGVSYSGLAKWFDLSLNFKHVLTESKNKWRREERPHINGTFKFNICKFSFIDRNRFEYKIREAGTDFWKYRNLLTIKFPCKFTSLEIQPYIADELHVDEVVSENRSYAGFTFKITKELGADIYYMQKRNRQSGGNWIGANVIGTRLKLDF